MWCRSEEAALQRLKEIDVPLKETALGVASNQMAKAVVKNLDQLDDDTISNLKTALLDLDDRHNPHAI